MKSKDEGGRMKDEKIIFSPPYPVAPFSFIVVVPQAGSVSRANRSPNLIEIKKLNR